MFFAIQKIREKHGGQHYLIEEFVIFYFRFFVCYEQYYIFNYY